MNWRPGRKRPRKIRWSDRVEKDFRKGTAGGVSVKKCIWGSNTLAAKSYVCSGRKAGEEEEEDSLEK